MHSDPVKKMGKKLLHKRQSLNRLGANKREAFSAHIHPKDEAPERQDFA